jgi:hypothetical protein
MVNPGRRGALVETSSPRVHALASAGYFPWMELAEGFNAQLPSFLAALGITQSKTKTENCHSRVGAK